MIQYHFMANLTRSFSNMGQRGERYLVSRPLSRAVNVARNLKQLVLNHRLITHTKFKFNFRLASHDNADALVVSEIGNRGEPRLHHNDLLSGHITIGQLTSNIRNTLNS